MALLDLLLYCDICTNQNMSCGFIRLSNLRNFFFCLIAQASVIVKVDDNDLSGSDQYDFYL